MRWREVVSVLVFFSLLLGLGLSHALAQVTNARDPNALPGRADAATVGAVIPILAGTGQNTIFFLYSTDPNISSSSPGRVKVSVFGTDGKTGPEVTKALAGTAGAFTILTASSDLAATASGVAVIVRATSAGGDTTGIFGGSVIYVDSQFGALWERPLIMGRGAGRNWPGFADVHLGTYLTGTGITTRIDVICPGSTSTTTTTTPSALTLRLAGTSTAALGIGLLPNSSTTVPTSSATIPTHYDVSVFNTSGALQGTTTGVSCSGANFQSVTTSSLSGFFSSGGGGLFRLTGSTAATHTSGEARGDLLAWRTIIVNISGVPLAVTLDERFQIHDPTEQ